jgi:hypothetical protein
LRYIFEWNPNKAKENLRKHRVSFDRAATVFLDPNILSIFDTDHSEEEDRWDTLGIDSSGIVLIVVHTFEQIDNTRCKIRIISARRATNKENEQYLEGLL